MTTPPRINDPEASKPKCACTPDTDSRTCYDLRHYGYSPVRRGPTAYYDAMDRIEGTPDLSADDGECICSCHQNYSDDDYE